MSTPSESPDLDRLRELLREREARRAAGKAIPQAAAERIARVITAGEPEPSVCDVIEMQLPEYIGAELRGEAAAQLFPEIHRHLMTCLACGALHAELLELETSPGLAPLPAPNLAGLLWPVEAGPLRDFVRRMAVELVKRLHLPLPGRFPALLDAFFEQVAEAGDQVWLQPWTAGAFGFDDSRSSSALKILLATWIATTGVRDRLVDEAPLVRYRRGVFEGILRQAAAEAVRRSGLRGGEGRRFTETFIELAHAPRMAQPDSESDA